MKKRLYKVLNKDMMSPYQGYRYEIGKSYYSRDFDKNPKYECSDGFYATDIEGLPYAWNTSRAIFEVEVWGKSVEIDQYKRRYSRIKIIRQCLKEEIVEKARQLEPKLGYKLSEILWPINPLSGRKKNVTIKHKNLLKAWDSIVDSVWDSVWASVGDSVWASLGGIVWNSVWDSVGDSVWNSVWVSVGDSIGDSVGASVWASVWASLVDSFGASVGAYISSLFPNIKKWKYIKHKEGENPFQPAIDLWQSGFVPSFDGKTWRLHSGKKAEVVWEWIPDGN